MLQHDDVHKALDVAGRRRKQLETRLRPAFGVFEVAGKVVYVAGVDPSSACLFVARVHVGRAECDAHKALAVSIEVLVEMHREPGRVDDAANFEVIVRKHDAQVSRAPFNMTAAGWHGESEALECQARSIEIPRRNDRMIDGFNAIVIAQAGDYGPS